MQDLGQRVEFEYVDFAPAMYASVGGVAYFYRSDGLHGRELWRSDGTAIGTHFVRDVCPGLCGSETFAPRDTLEAVGALVYFGGNDGVHGSELWVTDGTAAGTRMIADIRPGLQSSDPEAFASVGGRLYFSADDGRRGRELWRSDGTAAGTQLVAELVPGPFGGWIAGIEPGQGRIFLIGTGAASGVWASDGTAQGTVLLVSGIGLPQSTWPRGAAFRTLPDGLLLFGGCGPVDPNDCELWRSDGTTAGTFRVADLLPGAGGSHPSGFVLVGDEFWFSAYGSGVQRRLIRSDGTSAGTSFMPLPDDVEAITSSGGAALVGNRLYFVGRDEATGMEPWWTDGVTTERLADLHPGPDGSITGRLFELPLLVALGGELVFLADDGGGIRLWRSAGTVGTTVPLTDFGAPPPDSFWFDLYQSFSPPIVASDTLLLTLWKVGLGFEVWRSDGTVVGTSTLLALATERSAFLEDTRSMISFGPGRCFSPLRGGVVASVAEGPEQFVESFAFADGVPDGAVLLGRSFDLSAPLVPECASNGDEVLALGGPAGASGLLRSNGVENDATLLLPLDESQVIGSHPFFERFRGQLAFAAQGLLFLAPEGADVASFLSWPTEEVVGQLRAGPNLLFFGGRHAGLAVTDGETYTTLVPPPEYPNQLDLDDLVTSGDRAYFSLATPEEGAELWTSDGTSSGTNRVRDIRAGPASPFWTRELWERRNSPEPRIAGLGDGRAVFAADDAVHGTELWVSNGTEGDTMLLADLLAGPEGSWPRRLTSSGSTVVFAAEDPKHGLELWRTDGTAAGTALLRDLVVGPGSSVPEDLTVQDGLLYFSAWTPAHGREAWRSDGTPAGTYRITDLVPGARSSNPNRFLRSGELLFFVANDEIHGREVWALAPDGSFPLFLDGFESGATDRWSSTLP